MDTAGGTWAHGSAGVLGGVAHPVKGSGEPHRDHGQAGRNRKNERVSRKKVEGKMERAVRSAPAGRGKSHRSLKSHLFLLTREVGKGSVEIEPRQSVGIEP